MKPLSDESMVFDIDRKPIGLIFETFGPVKQPFYSIRFNNMEEIDQAGLKEEKPIYFAEGFADYVPTTKLLLEKGSDASWENDKEVDAVHMVRPNRAKDFNDFVGQPTATGQGLRVWGILVCRNETENTNFYLHRSNSVSAGFASLLPTKDHPLLNSRTPHHAAVGVP